MSPAVRCRKGHLCEKKWCEQSQVTQKRTESNAKNSNAAFHPQPIVRAAIKPGVNQHPPTYTFTHKHNSSLGQDCCCLLLQNMELRIILLLLSLSLCTMFVAQSFAGKLCTITVHFQAESAAFTTMTLPPGENQNKLKEKRAKAKRNKNNDAHTCSSSNCRCALESVCESNNPQSRHLPIRISELEQLYRLNHFHFFILWAAVSSDLVLGCY